MIKTKIIADSIYTDYATGKEHRVTTFELEYPRYIHSELLTKIKYLTWIIKMF